MSEMFTRLNDGMSSHGLMCMCSGLTRSLVFVAIVSSAALDGVRDFRRDHSGDNVLLEYQTAIRVRFVCHKLYVDVK